MVEDDSFVIYVTTPLKVQYVLGKFFVHNVSGCVALENKLEPKAGVVNMILHKRECC